MGRGSRGSAWNLRLARETLQRLFALIHERPDDAQVMDTDTMRGGDIELALVGQRGDEDVGQLVQSGAQCQDVIFVLLGHIGQFVHYALAGCGEFRSGTL